jgi:hypothetical protein
MKPCGHREQLCFIAKRRAERFSLSTHRLNMAPTAWQLICHQCTSGLPRPLQPSPHKPQDTGARTPTSQRPEIQHAGGTQPLPGALSICSLMDQGAASRRGAGTAGGKVRPLGWRLATGAPPTDRRTPGITAFESEAPRGRRCFALWSLARHFEPLVDRHGTPPGRVQTCLRRGISGVQDEPAGCRVAGWLGACHPAHRRPRHSRADHGQGAKLVRPVGRSSLAP